MCGIAGFTGLRDDQLIQAMSQRMKHRGPDGDGIYASETVTLLNRRLAIIDRAGGDQPIYNEDQSIVVVYNGEIYNYRELRAELEKAGHTFATASDTEILVHGYEEWGDKAFDRYNGMFACAIYDTNRDRLLIARDHFGIKPLYFAQVDSQLYFASEIKALLSAQAIRPQPNDRIIYRYLMYRIHDEADQTFFAGINRLLPGQMLIQEAGKVTISSYTTLQEDLKNAAKKPIDDPKAVQNFHDLLTESIRARLVSEVPVGTCLSGGLDSSTVVAVANTLLQEKAKDSESLGSSQKAFSAVFPGSINDEERYIDDLLKDRQNLTSIKVEPKPEDLFADLEDFIRTQEEPTISTGPYAQYQVMRRAHEDVTVLLDGQGADEMMAGYLPYYLVYLRQLARSGQYGNMISEIWHGKDILAKLVLQKLVMKLGFYRSIPVKSVLNPAFTKLFSEERFTTTSDNLRLRLIEDIFANSLQSLLRYEDKNAMRFSIEGRVPFLDLPLMKYLFSLPDQAIIKHGWNKAILRDAFRSMLPATIAGRRNKIGFTTPENEWFLRMKNRIYGIFLSESFANRPYVDQPAVLKAFEAFISGKTTDSMLFWRLLNIEIWLREFFDEPEAETKPAAEKGLFDPNQEKKIAISHGDLTWHRYPIKTPVFAKDDPYASKIATIIAEYRTKVAEDSTLQKEVSKPWVAIISEKIVAIAQGRSYFIWDIHPTVWAKVLSHFVKKTPYGIGLGSPWTMQLAINEVGLGRILFAAIASIVTKPLGISGTFYRIAGRTVASIDGPTEYSLYPSNVSAKLGPSQPHKAAESIAQTIRSTLSEAEQSRFHGAVIIDANDLGRDILGNASSYADETIAQIMRDNPMGQGSEQTPVVVAIAQQPSDAV